MPDTEALLQTLNESHERFVQAMVTNDGNLAVLAYRNYIHVLAQVLKRWPFSS